MNRHSSTDADLIALAKEGNLDAFDRVVVRHRARVLSLARQIVGDADAAQDVAQEAFLSAFRKLCTFRDQYPFKCFGAWLNSIVRRQALRWLRDGKRTPEPVDGEMMVMISGWMGQPEPAPPGELLERVQRALQVLSLRERDAMILHYLEGRTCEEIATHLHTSVGNVRQILFNSRRKAREEIRAMTQEKQVKKGPRRLTKWYNGAGTVSAQLAPLLAQTICSAVNKTAKSAPQIADEADANPAYVEEIADELVQLEVLESPEKGKYVANFIVFDAADWRRLMSMVREPAAKVAELLAGSEERVKTAYERTPLADSGWTWDAVKWVVYAVLTATTGMGRNLPESFRPPLPDRPGGGRYFLGGHERLENLPVIWSSGLECELRDIPFRHGSWCGVPRSVRYISDLERAVCEALLEQPLGEDELLSRLDKDREEYRGILAVLVKDGLVTRDNGRLRVGFPVFRQAESHTLTPAIDGVIGPIVADIAVPAFVGLDRVMDDMGYSHRRDQYPMWHGWLVAHVTGEALRFLMERGVLSLIPDPILPAFALLAWKGELPLMDWGVKYP